MMIMTIDWLYGVAAKRFLEFSRQEIQPAETMILEERQRGTRSGINDGLLGEVTPWRAECKVRSLGY